MKVRTTAKLAVIVIASQLLIGCGSTGNFNVSASPNTAALNGNWYITGNQQLKQYPFLSIALVVSGNQINAQGDMMVTCANLPANPQGGWFTLTGQINSDGTFHLGNFFPGGAMPQLTIDGSAPASGTSTWSGTYSFTSPTAPINCIVNQAASFTATPLAPINATYAGTLTGAAGNLTVNATIAQGAGITVLGPGTPYSYLPLSGTITVSGSPCFTHGTSSASNNGSQIEGDLAGLGFIMNDGSLLWINGLFTSPSESALYPTFVGVTGGNCNQSSYQGTLTRQ
jgi:hypothetical protein